MSFTFDAVAQEAFRRAQIRGHVFPEACDFPPSISRDVVELTYLAPLRALNNSVTTPLKVKMPVLQRGPLELTAYSREMDDASFATNGGDAWAAVLLLEESVLDA